MSTTGQLNAKLTKSVQTFLEGAGYYKGLIDGDIGPKSRAAARAWATKADSSQAKLDPRSSAYINGGWLNGATLKPLHPKLRPLATDHIKLLRTLKLDARVISGYRTYEEQNEIYNRHDGSTNARGGYSNHNFALAYDIGIFVDEDLIPDDVTSDDKYIEESGLYLIGVELGKFLGLNCGADWKSIVDTPHFEYRHGKTLAQLRALTAAGKDVLS